MHEWRAVLFRPPLTTLAFESPYVRNRNRNRAWQKQTLRVKLRSRMRRMKNQLLSVTLLAPLMLFMVCRSVSASEAASANERVGYVYAYVISMQSDNEFWLAASGVLYRQKARWDGPERLSGTIATCQFPKADFETLYAAIEKEGALTAVSDPQYQGMNDLAMASANVHTKSAWRYSKRIWGGTTNAAFDTVINKLTSTSCDEKVLFKGSLPMHWRPRDFPKGYAPPRDPQ